MRPIAVLNGVIFGSCLSIFLGLGVTGVIFALLAPEHPSLEAEFRPLLVSTLLFAILAVVSGISFWLQMKRHAGRWIAQAVMFAGLAVAVWYYLP